VKIFWHYGSKKRDPSNPFRIAKAVKKRIFEFLINS
jgi:hypothetical protein